jgi:hypothetical protein
MAELVTIPISFFEIEIDYERPDVKFLSDRASIVQGIFDALKPWNPSVDDIEPRTTGKFSEQGVNFKLPLKRVAFFFGPASCRFARDDANWDLAEETIAIIETSLAALIQLSGVTMGTKKTAIGVHIQPRKMPFMEMLKPFVAPQLAALEAEPVKTMAAVAKWGKRKVTIDGSEAIANGVFLKLYREFASASTYAEMAQQLQKDEAALFEILGVEEDRG